MKPIGKLILLAAACVIVFPLSPAQGQAALNNTTLGKSQNDPRDLVNSLIPGERKFGKSEKKEQVNSADLKSKSTKDTTFGGSLLDMGIVGAAPKLDEQKLQKAPSENEVKAPKESAAGNVKESKQSQTAAGSEKQSKGSTATAGDAQNKEQRSTSAATDEKPSATLTEKPSIAKPDGGDR